MVLAIREAVVNSTATTTCTTTTGAGTAVDDLLVAFHSMPLSGATSDTLTGTAGTWTARASYSNASDWAQIFCSTRPVTVAGAQTVTGTRTSSSQANGNFVGVLVVSGADLTTPLDGTPTNVSVAATTAVLPAVTTTATNSLLIGAVCATSASTSPTYTFTPPSGMTEQYDRNAQAGGFTAATLALTSAGSTGTKTFTASGSAPDMCGVLLAIRAAPVVITGSGFLPFFR